MTFAVYRESGSIDLVGWHPGTATLLIVEVKTELTSVEETLRRHDTKVRLAARVVGDRFGWNPRAVARQEPAARGIAATGARVVQRYQAIVNVIDGRRQDWHFAINPDGLSRQPPVPTAVTYDRGSW